MKTTESYCKEIVRKFPTILGEPELPESFFDGTDNKKQFQKFCDVISPIIEQIKRDAAPSNIPS
jgi:hypothetical protein